MATPWTVPKNLTGKTLAILASGPSMTRDISCVLLERGIPAIAVNSTAVMVAPWAQMVYAADTSWWSKYHDQIDPSRIKITCNDSVPFPDVKLIKQTGNRGFDPNPSHVRMGKNSGYQAVHIGLHTGASRILLFGLDMTLKYGVHCHGLHPNGLDNPSQYFFDKCLPYWNDLVDPAHVRNCEIINCSSISKITCFQKRTIEEILPCL